MRLIAIVPMLLFLIVTATVGVRLLLLARRSRELPEAAIGGGLVCVGLLGIPLAALGRLPSTTGTPLGDFCFLLGVAISHAGIALLFVFTWSVFRRGDRWGSLATLAAIALLIFSACGLGWNGIGEADLQKVLPKTRPFALLSVTLVGISFLWSGSESARYYHQLRRRLTLGLTDPVVTNRFGLWAIAGFATAAMTLGLGACLALGMSVLTEPIPLVTLALMGSSAGAAFYLSFLPPKRFLAAIQSRAATQSAAS